VHCINPVNAESNPIYHLLALLGARPLFHVSRIRVNVVQDEATDKLLCVVIMSFEVKLKQSHYRSGQP
jgi:hypothetical protein